MIISYRRHLSPQYIVNRDLPTQDIPRERPIFLRYSHLRLLSQRYSVYILPIDTSVDTSLPCGNMSFLYTPYRDLSLLDLFSRYLSLTNIPSKYISFSNIIYIDLSLSDIPSRNPSLLDITSRDLSLHDNSGRDLSTQDVPKSRPIYLR